MRLDGFYYALKQVLSRTRVQIVDICLSCTQGRWYLACRGLPAKSLKRIPGIPYCFERDYEMPGQK